MTILFKRYNFSLLVGKKKSLATLEACQEPVSSTFMIMVTHLISIPVTQELKISSKSHFHNSFPPTS